MYDSRCLRRSWPQSGPLQSGQLPKRQGGVRIHGSKLGAIDYDALWKDRRLVERLKSSIQAAQKFCLAGSMKMAGGAANWKPTRRWNPITFFCTPFSARATSAAFNSARGKFCAIRTKTVAADLSGWPSNISAAVKAYFALKMCGYSPTMRAWRAPRTYSGHGRRARLQYLQQIYLCASGSTITRGPGNSAEIVLFPSWFWFQHL